MANIELYGINTRANLLDTPASGGGGTLLFSEGFDDTNVGARGWYDNNTVTIDNTSPHGGAGSLQGTFTSGSTRPSWTILRKLFTPGTSVYMSVWVKYSTNWVGSSETFHPHEFHFLSDRDSDEGSDYPGLSDDYLTTYIEQNYQSGGIPRLAWQDAKNINTGANIFRTGGGTISGNDPAANTETRSIGGANGGVENGLSWEAYAAGTTTGYYNDKQLTDGVVRFQPSAGAGYKNNWNQVEAYFVMNSIIGGIGQHDGVCKYWFNGSLILNRSDILMRTNANANLKFKQFVIAPYIGDGSPVTQTVWYDDLIVATAPL